MRSESAPPVEKRTRRHLKREMERLFADEAITAGLDAACASKILTWAGRSIRRIELRSESLRPFEISAASHSPHRESEVACAIRAHARNVGQIALLMASGTDIKGLLEHLNQQFPTLPTDDLFSDVEEAIEILLAQWDAPHTGVPE